MNIATFLIVSAGNGLVLSAAYVAFSRERRFVGVALALTAGVIAALVQLL